MKYYQRILFYLGTDKDKPHKDMNKNSIKDLTINVHTHDTVYDKPLKSLLIQTNNQNKRFSFSRGDVITQKEQNNWTLCKNRCDGNTSSVLLRRLNFNRHWDKYYRKPSDMCFNKKVNKVFWRGITTGCSDHFSAKKWKPRKVNRFILVERWYNKEPQIDIGFSRIHRDFLKPKFSKYVKGECSPSYFLKHKYIISVEGNDKDSGLNWKLNSNSLVMMPKPTVNSWLMETTLIPNKHYILLKDDFSDLKEKVEWCNNNQDMCKTVISNAHKFMKQFSNRNIEQKIEVDVLNKYFEMKEKVANKYNLNTNNILRLRNTKSIKKINHPNIPIKKIIRN